MRTRFVGSLALLLGSTGLALGQAPAPTAPPPLAPVPVTAPAVVTEPAAEGQDNGGRLWGSTEYLLWWIKDGPLPFPLVLTGPGNTANPGALNAGGVPILTGDDITYGALSGVRATVGGWLGSDGGLGVEASGFLLPRTTKTTAASSDATGNPVLGFRYFDPPVGGVAAEDIFQASIPPGNPFGLGPLAGTIAVVSHTRLWGAEGNAVLGLNDRWQVLAGFRFAQLDEDLSLNLFSQAVDGGTEIFQGAIVPAPGAVASIDRFHTRNQFYGGQIGLRGDMTRGKLILGVTGKLGLGSMHEVEEVSGTSVLLTPGAAPITVPVGQFAGPSNIGRRSHDEFAVLPECQLRVGYQVNGWLRAYAGYDIMYLNHVIRPGNQVDLIVDDRTNPLNPAFVPGTVGTVYPQPMFNHSEFWAQGVDFGVELRF
jgi:hypothetical protein